MAAVATIPGGDQKGTPLDKADAKSIQYWIRRISDDLEKDPNKRFADKDRRWLEAARAELAKRRNGGAVSTPSTPTPDPTATTALATSPQKTAFSLDKVVHDPSAASHRLKDMS